MKNSKMIILAIIILIVVIKCMKGDVKEGFTVPLAFKEKQLAQGRHINDLHMHVTGEYMYGYKDPANPDNTIYSLPRGEHGKGVVAPSSWLKGQQTLHDRVKDLEAQVFPKEDGTPLDYKRSSKIVRSISQDPLYMDREGNICDWDAYLASMHSDTRKGVGGRAKDARKHYIDNGWMSNHPLSTHKCYKLSDKRIKQRDHDSAFLLTAGAAAAAAELKKTEFNKIITDFNNKFVTQTQKNKAHGDAIDKNERNISTNFKSINKNLTAIPVKLKNKGYLPWVGTIEAAVSKFGMKKADIQKLYGHIENSNDGIIKEFTQSVDFHGKDYINWKFELDSLQDINTSQNEDINLNLINLSEHEQNESIHFKNQTLTHNHNLEDLTGWSNHTNNHKKINNSITKLSKDHNDTLEDYYSRIKRHTNNHKNLDKKHNDLGKKHNDLGKKHNDLGKKHNDLGKKHNDLDTKFKGNIKDHDDRLKTIDTKLIFWKAQFEKGVDQDFKVKCLKDGEYGWGPEHCPAWLKKITPN